MLKYETDSRLVKPGQTFVAIVGETVDGHDYIEDAIKNGASKIVVSKEVISRMNSEEVLKAVLEWSKKYSEEIYNVISKDTSYSKKIFALERDGAKKIRKDIYKWEDIMSTFFYFFDEYYEGREQAVAYKLKGVVEYDKPKMLNEYGIKSAPQSFCYLSE